MLYQPEVAGIKVPVFVDAIQKSEALERFQGWWDNLDLSQKKALHPEPENYNSVEVVEVHNNEGVIVLP